MMCSLADTLAALQTNEAALEQFLCQFVQAESVYDPQRGTTEEPAARTVFNLLTAWGWSPLWEEVAPGRPNIIATLTGNRPDHGRRLIIEGHTDVVTPGDQSTWQYPPFAATIIDGKLYGRGTADMKGGVAAALFAVRAIQQSGADFSGTIVLAIVADEEGLMLGIKDFVARGHADHATAALICEPEGGRVCIAQKGALRLHIAVQGRMAHGAMPHAGANPLLALVAFLAGCEELESALRQEFGVHQYLDEPYITPTVLSAGTAAQMNVIPDYAAAYLDIRTIPETPHPLIMNRLRALANTVEQRYPERQITITVIDDRPATATDPTEPLVATIVAAHTAEWGAAPPFGGVPGTTDGTILWRERGIPLVTYGPGDTLIPHQVNEFVRLAEVHAAARVYVRTILAYLS